MSEQNQPYQPKKLKLTDNSKFFRLKKSTPYDVSANSRIWGCKTLRGKDNVRI